MLSLPGLRLSRTFPTHPGLATTPSQSSEPACPALCPPRAEERSGALRDGRGRMEPGAGCVGLSRQTGDRGRGDDLGKCRDAGEEGKASAGSRKEGLSEERWMCAAGSR